MSSHYLPDAERDLEGWLFNFSSQLQTIGANLGLTPAQLSSIENNYLACKYLLDIEDLFKAELHSRTEYKNSILKGRIGLPITNYPDIPTLPAVPPQVEAGIIKRVEALVQLIKNSPNYDEATGQVLKIIMADSATSLDRTKLKPEIRVFENNTVHVALKWVKGEMDGVTVFVNTEAATAPAEGTLIDAEAAISWVEYARCNYSPFIDDRKNSGKQPETRL